MESFGDLLASAKAGEDAAWAALYHDLAPRIRGFLRGLSAEDPDDLLGEVFVQAVQDLRRFEGDERAFRAWMFKLAHNRLIDAKRRARRRPERLMALVPEVQPRGGAASDTSHSTDAEEVTAVLSRLSRDQATVLLLRVVGDLTVPEVARVLGKRAGAVKALQRRGLAAIRREIEGQPYPSAAARRLLVSDPTLVSRHG